MNTEQKLTKIREKCAELLAQYPPCESTAGWKATIAAIDDCIYVDETQPEDVQKIALEMMIQCNQVMIEKIIAAWEGLV